MMECPYCKEIALPEPDGGDCEECGLTSYFRSATEEMEIAEAHWMYHHDWNVSDGWLVQSIIGLVTRIGYLPD